MDLGLKERVAIVTGSSQGIGKAIALSLSQEGAKVTICARNRNALVGAAEEIEAQTGNEILPVRTDLMKPDEIKKLVNNTAKHFDRIDILVNNTGGPPATTFTESSDQHWQDTYNSLFVGVVQACRAVVPHMQKAKWGRMINMTSFVAKQPAERLILSNAIQAGIFGLSKSLANELEPFDILVNAVCPEWTLTRRVEELAMSRAKTEGRSPKEIVADWEKQIPLKRLALPREVADLVVFLASARASYITGTVIQVDGGVIRSLL